MTRGALRCAAACATARRAIGSCAAAVPRASQQPRATRRQHRSGAPGERWEEGWEEGWEVFLEGVWEGVLGGGLGGGLGVGLGLWLGLWAEGGGGCRGERASLQPRAVEAATLGGAGCTPRCEAAHHPVDPEQVLDGVGGGLVRVRVGARVGVRVRVRVS